ncbi:MAG: DUF4097 family beta strand repeat-containing protein [Candidatus Aminicenantes bacterium]|nr:DUF4097 family beta strand repeat-containing protein [Candidatus Aminicenantes bacterium]
MRAKTSRLSILAGGLLVLAAAFGVACDFMDDGNFGDIFDGPEYTEPFAQTLPLKAGEQFSLKNTNGFIRVTTWDRNEVEISAKKIATRRKENLDRVKIEVEALGSAVRVDTIYEKFRNVRVKVNYEVKVPEGVILEAIRSTNGDIELTGRFADVKAGTTNGDILVEGGDGRIDLSTTNGTIRGRNLRGSVAADTTNGSIHLELDEVKNDIRADTTNGSINLRLGGAVNAEFSARSTNGSITVDFPVTIQGTISSRHRIQGRIGDGGPAIELETTNGSIRVNPLR